MIPALLDMALHAIALVLASGICIFLCSRTHSTCDDRIKSFEASIALYNKDATIERRIVLTALRAHGIHIEEQPEETNRRVKTWKNTQRSLPCEPLDQKTIPCGPPVELDEPWDSENALDTEARRA